jgi:tetratricopeptide (TPR) repeat protein
MTSARIAVLSLVVLGAGGCGSGPKHVESTAPPAAWADVVARSEAMRLAADWDGAHAAVVDALAATPATELDARVRLLVERAAIEREVNSYRRADDLVAAAATLAEADALVTPAVDSGVRAALAEQHGWVVYSKAFGGKATFADARVEFDRARALYEERPEESGAALAMVWFEIGLTEQQSGKLAEARAAFATGLELARRHDAPVPEGYLARHYGYVEGELAKDPAKAVPHYRRSLELREAHGHRWGVVFAAVLLAEGIRDDDAAGARALLDRAVAIGVELRVTRGLAQAYDGLAELDQRANDTAGACANLARAIAAHAEYGDAESGAEVATRRSALACP